ncbi:MAG TPA: ABC transporter ATP-binding protein [Terriglobales bacterium]|jgi:ABC-2 type transport system ATP-binding protein|nr:ABC transporter ATP-binding protein [Terriglobales bacterium]
MTSAIRTEALGKRFLRLVALHNLNLDVPTGAVYALVGPNGAGKTTLIKILMNIFQASAGRATVMGMPSTSIAGDAFKTIGYVSENQELPDWMRVDQFLRYVAAFHPKWDRTLEQDLMRQFDLPLNRRLKNLSRGMRMKAALTSALAFHPALIVLDEPFSGLDPFVRDQLVESLVERAAESTMLISSHDLAEIENFATHVGYLDQGTLKFSEELASLTQRFREVEVVRETSAPLPASAPATWLQLSDAAAVVRFIETRFDTERTAEQVRSVFGNGVRDITFTPMSLRSIFLAIAKSPRSVAS